VITVQAAGLTGAEKSISRVVDRVVDEAQVGRLRQTFGVLAAYNITMGPPIFAPLQSGTKHHVLVRGCLELGIPVVPGGPIAITAGTFGKRPHCIFRGFCNQGCKVARSTRRWSATSPTRSSTGPRSARAAWRSTFRRAKMGG